MYALKVLCLYELGFIIFKLKFLLIYSLSYGQFKSANPLLIAVYPISLAIPVKKCFFSKSLAIIGSNTIEVLPEPETPTTKEASNLLPSGTLTILPVSLSLQIAISQVYGQVPAFVSDKSIPP